MSPRTPLAAAAMALLVALPGSALAQDPADEVELLEPCALEDGQTALTREGLSEAPAAPEPGGSSSLSWVVDLAGEPEGTVASVGIDLTWDLRIEDFGLAVDTPSGQVASDALQPDAEPVEHVSTDALGHCAELTVTIDNTLAPVGQGLTITATLDPEPYTAPPTLSESLPEAGGVPSAAVIVAPPNGAASGFVPTDLVITEGGSLTLAGADTTVHNVACKDLDEDRRPLCRSEYVAAAETAPVEGVESLPPGEYALLCQLHPAMQATLTVLDV